MFLTFDILPIFCNVYFDFCFNSFVYIRFSSNRSKSLLIKMIILCIFSFTSCLSEVKLREIDLLN